jgi:probable phosphoglycerate mutase
MNKILLIRHGQTDANVEKIIQGTEHPLNILGNEQAEKLAKKLLPRGINFIYSSPLIRAVQTAEKISNNCNVNIITDQSLAEIDMGIFTNYTRKEIKEKFQEEYKNYTKNDLYIIPGGESYEMFRNRIISCLDIISNKHPPGSIICIVTHGGVLECVRRVLEHKKSRSSLIFQNTSVSELNYDTEFKKWSVEYWNDESHLI